MPAKKKRKKPSKVTKRGKKATARRKTSTAAKAKGSRKTLARRVRGETGPKVVQSGDLQGLSKRERADSESVDELLEEGNAFEAGIVEGVEEADEAEERGVETREVPEDDVPEEYLDKDS